MEDRLRFWRTCSRRNENLEILRTFNREISNKQHQWKVGATKYPKRHMITASIYTLTRKFRHSFVVEKWREYFQRLHRESEKIVVCHMNSKYAYGLVEWNLFRLSISTKNLLMRSPSPGKTFFLTSKEMVFLTIYWSIKRYKLWRLRIQSILSILPGNMLNCTWRRDKASLDEPNLVTIIPCINEDLENDERI